MSGQGPKLDPQCVNNVHYTFPTSPPQYYAGMPRSGDLLNAMQGAAMVTISYFFGKWWRGV